MNFIFLINFILISTSQSISLEDLTTFFDEDNCIEGKLIDTNTGPMLLHNDNLIKLLDKTHQKEDTKTENIETIVSQIETKNHGNKNPLQLLNELAQLNKIKIDYVLTKEEGLPHQRVFHIKLYFGDEIYFNSANSKSTAKTKLALQALSATKYKRPDKKPNKGVEEYKETVITEAEELTPTVQLNNIAAKLGMKVEYINDNGKIITNEELLNEDVSSHNYYSLDSSSKSYFSKLNDSIYHQKSKIVNASVVNEAAQGPFTVRLIVGSQEYIGGGLSIQAARHDAAKLALEYFKSISVKQAEECINQGVECNKINIKSPISIIYETATKKGVNLEFQIIETKVENNQQVFTTLCIFGDLTTRADGSSKKKSKRKSAEMMIKELESQGPLLLSNTIDITSEPSKKKRKKKKKKITQGFMNNIQNGLEDTASSIYSYFNGNTMPNEVDVQQNDLTESGNDATNNWKHKNEFLSLTRSIDINVKFSSFQMDNLYSTIVTLETDPSYICFGKDAVKGQSEDNASLAALLFIKQIGFDNIIMPLKKNTGVKIVLPSDKKKPIHGVNNKF